TVPIQVVTVDPTVGEELSPVAVAPAVTVQFDKPVYTFVSSVPKTVKLHIRALTDRIEGEVRLNLGDGRRSVPESVCITGLSKDESREVIFGVGPPNAQCRAAVSATVRIEDRVYRHGYRVIDYPHIQLQHYFPKAEANFIRVRLAPASGRIGYVCGAKDRLPECLREMGYTVTELTPGDLTVDSLGYDAIILGIRAYNVHRQLGDLRQRLLEY